MGYNTVVVLFNDQTHAIRDSGPMGARIARAMQSYSDRETNPLATWFGEGQVVSQAHADYSQVVVVGQNRGRPIVECDDLDYYAIGQIADTLRRHGWVVKPPSKTKRKSK